MFYLKRKLIGRSGSGWKYAAIGLLACSILAGSFIQGFAQELPEILPVNPVPWIDSGEGPPMFLRIGKLDRLGANEVVVNDSLIMFSTEVEVTFYSATGAFEIEPSSFEVGDKVGCEFDEGGKLKALWLLDE